jgi:TRAP-type mannitol/chloroaromatic compound transport system permease small subunit
MNLNFDIIKTLYHIHKFSVSDLILFIAWENIFNEQKKVDFKTDITPNEIKKKIKGLADYLVYQFFIIPFPLLFLINICK